MTNAFAAAAIAALLFVVLACGSSTPPPAGYVGVWTGSDGTHIAIRGDGSADYRSGASHITGGSAVIDEEAKSLKISFAGMGPTYTIDKAPSTDQMTLSGVVFRKSGVAPTTAAGSKTAANIQNSNRSDDDQ